MVTVIAILVGYVLGGIPFGVLLARRAGVYVQQAGSGNTGATNVARTAGRGLGFLTLGLDVSKGVLAVGLGAALGGPRLAAGAGGAAILGHVLSPFLRFRGGKGVATAAGVFGALSPLALTIAVALFSVGFALSRVVSIGSLMAALALPVATWGLRQPTEVVGIAVAVCLLVWVRHIGNLRRLFRRTEPAWHGRKNVGDRDPKPPIPGDCSPTRGADAPARPAEKGPR